MNPVEICTPNNINELITALSQATPHSKVLAGGTDLIISLHERKIKPDLIIELSKVKELAFIRQENEFISIGALTTFTEIKENDLILKYFPCLAEAAARVGSVQIRNRATIGGNIANASPAGDSLPVLSMLNAQISIINPHGSIKECTIDEILMAPRKTNLSYNEAIVSIKIPIPHPSFRSAFVKLGTRTTVTIAMINMAMGINFDEQTQKITDASLVLGAISPTTLRVPEIEKIFIDRTLDHSLLTEFSQMLSQLIEKTAPIEFEMEYKKDAVKGVSSDLLHKLLPEIF
ncbi:MAG: FAD binding domain-containing protein [Bacillota bacterium]|jgi:CO/xanthine dehydrogenase FAD-binding subunit